MKTDNAWIQTKTGKKFHFLDPSLEEIDIQDIAHALSQQCRFNGHCKKFLSVAEHSVNVSEFLPDHLALAGLLHDAAEAYIGDCVQPQKDYLTNFRQIEGIIINKVALKFNLAPDFHLNPEIKKIDYQLCYTEGKQLMPDVTAWHTHKKCNALPLQIKCFAPQIAKNLFLRTFYHFWNY